MSGSRDVVLSPVLSSTRGRWRAAGTHAGFRARSRHGWTMTALVHKLARELPPDVQLDGEIVAYDPDARPTSTASARGCCTATRWSR